MEIEFSRKFKKQFKKLPSKTQEQFKKRLQLLITNPRHPHLNVHSLKGEYADYASFNVNADVRVVFEMSTKVVYLVAVGSHSQLYE